jgi:hypothetical protein
LSRLVASWLIILVVAPFTAPFSTCDLRTWFGGTKTRSASAPMPNALRILRAYRRADSPDPIAPPVSSSIARADDAVPSWPSLFSARRMRQAPLRVSSVRSEPSSTSGSAWHPASLPHPTGTIDLRIQVLRL